MERKKDIELLQEIEKYIRGELNQAEIDELWKKFLQNPEYYDLFETEIHLKSLIRKGRRPLYSEPENKNNDEPDLNLFQAYGKWIIAAAAAMIIALGLQLFTMETVEPVQSLAVAEIEKRHLVAADVIRSDEESADELDVLINRAIAQTHEGSTEDAIQLMREVLSASPDPRQQILVNLNLGILLYNVREFRASIPHFQEVAKSENIAAHRREKAWWFLGNAYLQLEELREAREAVLKTYGFNGQFFREALALIKEIDLRIDADSAGSEPQQLGR